MILRIPDYYDEFRCIAGDCSDSCCVGWELDIDEKSYNAYKEVKGDFGNRLRSVMVDGSDETGECNTFRLNGERCPFLNEKNLCDIYINLGEHSLCKVCTEYPRFTVEYGDVREKSMALSCEAVGGLIFGRTDRLRFIEREVPDEEISEGGEAFFIEEIEYIRDKSIEILQDREHGAGDRIRRFMSFAAAAQNIINEGAESGCIDRIKGLRADCKEAGRGDAEPLIAEVLYLLEGLEVLGSEWSEAFSQLQESFTPELIGEFEAYREKDNLLTIWYEHILVYFVFRYFTKAVYDCDVISRAKFAFLGFFVILGLAALRYRQNGGFFCIDDMIWAAKAYSKEVEHSEGNIAYLLEEFLYSEELSTENITGCIADILR